MTSRRLPDDPDSPGESNPVMNRTSPDPVGIADLEKALSAFRDDVRRAPPPRSDLAERVLAAVAHGEDEILRFRRLARAYTAAAAVLVAVGVGGTLLVQGNRPQGSPLASSVADLEASRLSLEKNVTLTDLAVGGR